MSGHSKWSNIKNKKAANDAVKGSVFTKLAKAITVAYRTNHGINIAIQKAKEVNMPKENIDRAIAKGLGQNGSEIVEMIIEGFAYGGVAIMIQAVTDNKNRTMMEMRLLFDKYGGRIGEIGSVSYMFEKTDDGYKPKYLIPVDEPKKILEFIEILKEHDDVSEVYVNLE